MKRITRILAVCALALTGCAYTKFETADGMKVTSARLLWMSDIQKASAGTNGISLEGYAGQGQEGALEAVARGAAAGATQP